MWILSRDWATVGGVDLHYWISWTLHKKSLQFTDFKLHTTVLIHTRTGLSYPRIHQTLASLLLKSESIVALRLTVYRLPWGSRPEFLFCNWTLADMVLMQHRLWWEDGFVSYEYRPTVSRPVCLGVQLSSGAQDQIFITVKQLMIFRRGAPSLTRGQVSIKLSLVLASAVILGTKSRAGHDHILLTQFRDFAKLEGQIPVFTSPSE
jgi:hypothetical protein